MSAPENQPLYRRVLGAAWDRLPAEIRELHSVTTESSFSGTCTVERGRNPLSRLVALFYGFPEAGGEQPVVVNLKVRHGTETWTRTIGKSRFSSLQSEGQGRAEGLLTERFGPVSADLALVVDGAKLHYVIRRWRLFGIPMPRGLGPRSTAFEAVEHGVFQFDVEIGHRLIGRIVRYRGALIRSPPSPAGSETRDTSARG